MSTETTPLDPQPVGKSSRDDSRRLFLALGAFVAVVVGLDQLTKEWALDRLSGGRVIEVLPTLEFDLTFNTGFSFSTGSGSGQLIGALVIVVSGFLIWQIIVSTDRGRSWLLTGILAGALGNLVDRIFRADDGFLSGKVVDFIDVTWYAVFNVADMFVVCSAIGLLLYELWLRPRRLRGQGSLPSAQVAADDAVEH